MSNDQTLNATFWTMVAIQTIGSVDMPGSGNRKMPAPRAYVAIVITWSVLSLLAEAGQTKLASRMSLLLVLAGAAIGPFGQRFASFLNTAASTVAGPAATATGSSQDKNLKVNT